MVQTVRLGGQTVQYGAVGWLTVRFQVATRLNQRFKRFKCGVIKQEPCLTALRKREMTTVSDIAFRFFPTVELISIDLPTGIHL